MLGHQIWIVKKKYILQDSGSDMEKRFAGPRGASIKGLKSGERDLTENNHWGHLVRTCMHDQNDSIVFVTKDNVLVLMM